MASFPTTIHIAIPLLTAAAIVVFVTNAVLTFAPRVRIGLAAAGPRSLGKAGVATNRDTTR
jgi:hypothetical protein